MRYKYILWDWNGTLIDDVQNALMCVNDMCARKGKPEINIEQYYSYIETPIIGFYRHILSEDEIDADEIFENYHNDYLRHLPETRLAEGAKEVLRFFKERGAKQYIVTATHIDEAVALTKKYGVADYFDGIFGADNKYAESKTARAQKFFKEYGIRQSEAVFIGDLMHDYETANALGIAAVLVSYGHQGRKILENGKVLTVDSLFEVRDIVADERTVDLHTHSTCSDGTLTPAEVVDHAKKMGLSAIALTDHDSVDGVKEAENEAKKVGLELIPGIEFSASADAEIHIIGLFLDTENRQLIETIEKLKSMRRGRMEEILSKLRNMGFKITYDEALALAGDDFVGRAHIAALMVMKGYVSSKKEAFQKYIGIGKPAYTYNKKITPREAVETVKSAGGLAFLAHLNQTNYSEERLSELLGELKNYGLDGIEGYYTEYSEEQTALYRTLAEKHSLTFAGGSDFHAAMKTGVEIGVGEGNLVIPYHVLQNLKNIKARADD